jgi:hypothetical protein
MRHICELDAVKLTGRPAAVAAADSCPAGLAVLQGLRLLLSLQPSEGPPAQQTTDVIRNTAGTHTLLHFTL